ncbi:MAG: deoxyribonuclease IV [Tetrasphaera sp.]
MTDGARTTSAPAPSAPADTAATDRAPAKRAATDITATDRSTAASARPALRPGAGLAPGIAPTPAIGAHVPQEDPIERARERHTSVVQFFLGEPQSYKGPVIAYAGGADALRADAAAAGVDLYVHAPYIVNVATTNNRIRIPSRKLLQQHLDAAAQIGAKALIVHGGHVDKNADPAVGFDNWRKAIDATDLKIPLLIENTAGGDNAMARHLDRIAGVWDAISRAEGADRVGFCLDTCHAWAGGIELDTAVDKIRGITGRIDLVHANDSRDGFDSGADRHANFGAGKIDQAGFVDIVRAAGAPVICESPGAAEQHLADFAWLRARL